MSASTSIGSSVPPSARKVQAIRDFTAAGYALIPCNGKNPIPNNWQETGPGDYPEALLAQNNYGIVLKAGDLVVDIDPRNFRPGDDPVARLIEKVGPLVSFTVNSGGGGKHIYLTKPADVLVRNSLPEFPGIEFKAAGRQMIGPGSIHPESGKEYVTAQGSITHVSPAAPALLALILRASIPFDEIKGTGKYINDAATQGRYLAYLQDVAKPSIQGQNGDHNAFQVACKGRDFALPPAVTWELMLEVWNPRCSPPWDAEALRAKVINAYTYAGGAVGSNHPAADFAAEPLPLAALSALPKEKEEALSWVTKGPKGAMVKCFQNLITFMRYPKAGLAGVFGYNEFTGRIEFTNPAPWHKGKMPTHVGVGDNDLKLLKGHLAMRHGYEADVSNIEEAITNVAFHNRFHPVREYLDSLTWDKQLRLDTWLIDYLGVEDTAYTRACARKVLCAAVMRVMRPGCKFDHVLVFEGLQGIGKSSVCKILGGDWAADFTLDPHNKDSIQLMQGRWIIELAEMETTRRADLQALKAFISRPKDEARLAYGRTVGEFPRQSIFIGSINPGADGTYLQDEENRRWWPVHCAPPNGIVDFRALKDARNQLWAEAVHIVKTKGEHLYMETAELKDAAHKVVGARHAEHAWTERIEGWLQELDTKPDTRKDFLTVRDVYIEAMGGVDKQLDRRAELGIAAVLKRLGWKRGFKWDGKRSLRGYLREAPVAHVAASAQKDAPAAKDPLDIIAGLM